MIELTPFQHGVLEGIEAANFCRPLSEITIPIFKQVGQFDEFNQGVEYGFGIHNAVMKTLAAGGGGVQE